MDALPRPYGRQAEAPPLLRPTTSLTHGVCVGMTGSGKTGLCVDLLEELLLADTPLFLLDPEGRRDEPPADLPEASGRRTSPPWVDPETARRAGRSAARRAPPRRSSGATGSRSGTCPLESLARLARRSATGSSRRARARAGRSTCSARSRCPSGLSFDRDEEAVRDEIRGAGLRASDARRHRGRSALRPAAHPARADPRDALAGGQGAWTSPTWWRSRRTRRSTRVGAMDLDAVLPRAKRRELALALNNLLSSPDFDSWREGEPLDPRRLLRDASGRARAATSSTSRTSTTRSGCSS